MKYSVLFKENWFLSVVIIPMVLAFLFLNSNSWLDANFKTNFFQFSIIYFLIGCFFWITLNHKELFSKSNIIRNAIVVVGSVAVLLWTYKHKITFRFDLLLLFLCAIQAFRDRKFLDLSPIILSLLIFSIFKFIGIFWNDSIDFHLSNLNEDQILLILFSCIIGLFFRVTQKERNSFIAISFKFFLALLSLNITAYILYSKSINLPFFSFFTLNKGYASYYEVLNWSFLKHPSFISWIILFVGNIGVFASKYNKKLISNLELVAYFVFLLFFIFIVQARVAIIGYFISLSFFIWLRISKKLKIQTKTIIISCLLVVSALGIWHLTHNTKYFSDPIREKIINISLNKISESPFYGFGSGTNKNLYTSIGIVHSHNDFMASLIDLGVVGFSLLTIFILSCFYVGIKNRDNTIIISIITILLLINTDSLFFFNRNSLILIPIFMLILFTEHSANDCKALNNS